MPMQRLFTMIALVVLTTLPAVTATATTPTAQGDDCEDITAYIEMVDTQVVDEMHVLVTTPGWAEDAQVAIETIDTADPGMEGVTTEVMQPLLDYLAIPGTVLEVMDPADVPEAALPLHESARDYWLATEDMLGDIVEEDPDAAFPFMQIIETASAENIVAQQGIADHCPGLIESYEDDRERVDLLFGLLYGQGDPGVLADPTPEDLKGIGFSFLFFAEEALEVGEPARVSTPAVVTAPSPATVGTPED